MAVAVGVDVGGSGIKVGLVDVERGALIGPRLRVKTPQPSTPAVVVPIIVKTIRRSLLEAGVTAPDVPVGLDTNIKGSDVNANVDKSGNVELQTGDVSAEVSRSGNVELNTGDVSASTTSAGATELKAGDVDASVGSDGSVGLNVGGINLNVR